MFLSVPSSQVNFVCTNAICFVLDVMHFGHQIMSPSTIWNLNTIASNGRETRNVALELFTYSVCSDWCVHLPLSNVWEKSSVKMRSGELRNFHRNTILRGGDEPRRSSSPKSRRMFISQSPDSAFTWIDLLAAPENACPTFNSDISNAVTATMLWKILRALIGGLWANDNQNYLWNSSYWGPSDHEGWKVAYRASEGPLVDRPFEGETLSRSNRL